MTKEEANHRLNIRMDETSIYFDWKQRYSHFKSFEPCIAETYRVFITGGMNPSQFYEKAVNDIMAAYSPLGKLL